MPTVRPRQHLDGKPGGGTLEARRGRPLKARRPRGGGGATPTPADRKDRRLGWRWRKRPQRATGSQKRRQDVGRDRVRPRKLFNRRTGSVQPPEEGLLLRLGGMERSDELVVPLGQSGHGGKDGLLTLSVRLVRRTSVQGRGVPQGRHRPRRGAEGAGRSRRPTWALGPGRPGQRGRANSANAPRRSYRPTGGNGRSLRRTERRGGLLSRVVGCRVALGFPHRPGRRGRGARRKRTGTPARSDGPRDARGARVLC